METMVFKTMANMAVEINDKKELFTVLRKERAPVHAMAIMMYSFFGGYNRVLENLRKDVVKMALSKDNPPTDYRAQLLVEHARTLKKKSDETVRTLNADGVLTDFMIRKIEYRYLRSPVFVKNVKDYLHDRLADMLRETARGY